MKSLRKMIYCEHYERYVLRFQCENCDFKDFMHLEYEQCPNYKICTIIILKIKEEDLYKIKRYAKSHENHTVDHYIREAVKEYLENHE